MATLPYADSLLDDQNSGFLRAINMRTSYRSYLKAKSLAVVLSGGISVIGLLLLTFVFSLFINQSDLSNLSYASLSVVGTNRTLGAVWRAFRRAPVLLPGRLYCSPSLYLVPSMH